MALFFSDNPITLNKDPMVSRISVSFDIEDHLDFSQDQEEKQLPGGASQQALVFFEDGFSSLYKPDEQVYFNNGERITLFGPTLAGSGSLIAESDSGKIGEWKSESE